MVEFDYPVFVSNDTESRLATLITNQFEMIEKLNLLVTELEYKISELEKKGV